jgi:hypothetical protein
MHRGAAAQRGGDRRGWGRQGKGRGAIGEGWGLDNDGVALTATVAVKSVFPVSYAGRGLAPPAHQMPLYHPAHPPAPRIPPLQGADAGRGLRML